MTLGHSTIRDSCLRLGWKVVFPIGCIQGRLFYTTVCSSHRMAEIHSHFLSSCFCRSTVVAMMALAHSFVLLCLHLCGFPPHCLPRGHFVQGGRKPSHDQASPPSSMEAGFGLGRNEDAF